jgi:hypothetical protein
LSKEVLVKLKEDYDNCLCAACLKSFEVTEHATNESGAA